MKKLENQDKTDPEARSKNIANISVRLANVSRLLQTPEFKWFMETCVKPELETATEKALDTNLPTEIRDIQCHVRGAIDRIFHWPEEELKSLQERKKNLDAS